VSLIDYGPDEPELTLRTAGWTEILPDPALNAYVAIETLDGWPGGPVEGDLDDLGAADLNLAWFGGLDAEYDPHAPLLVDGGRVDPEPHDLDSRWKGFVAHAERRGLPMRTPRDAIEFMRHLGLLERAELDGRVRWRPAIPVPEAEEALRRERKTAPPPAPWRRTDLDARDAAEQAIYWLIGQRGHDHVTQLTTSLAELAEHLHLDDEDVRNGLGSISWGGDIVIKPRPSGAGMSEALTITVDWTLFDECRVPPPLATIADRRRIRGKR
jgi:hypothetical protein